MLNIIDDLSYIRRKFHKANSMVKVEISNELLKALIEGKLTYAIQKSIIKTKTQPRTKRRKKKRSKCEKQHS